MLQHSVILKLMFLLFNVLIFLLETLLLLSQLFRVYHIPCLPAPVAQNTMPLGIQTLLQCSSHELALGPLKSKLGPFAHRHKSTLCPLKSTLGPFADCVSAQGPLATANAIANDQALQRKCDQLAKCAIRDIPGIMIAP
eukprot:g36393.t1